MDREIRVTPAVMGVGALVVATWVALLWAIFRRPAAPALAGPAINVWNVLGDGVKIPAQLGKPAAETGTVLTNVGPTTTGDFSPATPRPSTLATYSLNTTIPSRLATASGTRFWVVEVRTVGPPGSFAIVSPVANALTQGNVPGYDAVVIPAGGDNRIRLAPGQALFGVGNVNNTIVSVNCSEEYLSP